MLSFREIRQEIDGSSLSLAQLPEPCNVLMIHTKCFLFSLSLKMQKPLNHYYTLIDFDERVNILASTRRVTALYVHVCGIACVCDCVMVICKPTPNNATYAHAQGSDRTHWSQKVTLSSKVIKL